MGERSRVPYFYKSGALSSHSEAVEPIVGYTTESVTDG